LFEVKGNEERLSTKEDVEKVSRGERFRLLSFRNTVNRGFEVLAADGSNAAGLLAVPTPTISRIRPFSGG